MYSDDWHRKNYRFERQVEVLSPVYYRHVYNELGDLVGVIVDYEFADDYHYEILADNWNEFCRRCLDTGNEKEAFRMFLEKQGLDTVEGQSAFEFAMKKTGVRFNKIAFY